MEPLYEDTQNTSRAGANSEGRDEDTRGDLDTERDDSQCPLDDKGNEDGVDDGHGLLRRVDDAEPQVSVLATWPALREEVVDELCATHTRVRVHEGEHRCSESHEEDFGNRVRLQPRCIANVTAPAVVQLREPCAVDTLKNLSVT